MTFTPPHQQLFIEISIFAGFFHSLICCGETEYEYFSDMEVVHQFIQTDLKPKGRDSNRGTGENYRPTPLESGSNHGCPQSLHYYIATLLLPGIRTQEHGAGYHETHERL